MFSQLFNVYVCSLIKEASPSTRNLDKLFNGELINDFTCLMSCSFVSSDLSMNFLQDVLTSRMLLKYYSWNLLFDGEYIRFYS
jgi:hypothetical protein